jgi:hypothetical protein
MVLGALMWGLGVIAAGCSSSSQCSRLGISCPQGGVTLVTSCDGMSFMSNCNSVSGASGIEITGAAAQTCDASITLSDGTVHTVHVVISDPPAAGSCGCPPVAPMEVTVDGKGSWREGSTVAVDSPTCTRPDAGGGSDAAVDAPAE